MSSKSKQGRRNRRYGHDAERELARELKELGLWAERITSESKHGNLGDVVFRGGEPQAQFKVQIKSGKRPSPWKAIEQAVETCAATPYVPIGLVNKSNGPGLPRDRLIIMHVEDFFNLLRRAFPSDASQQEQP